MMDSRGLMNTNTNNTNTNDEIGKLIRQGANDVQVLNTIKEKYGDKQMVNQVFAEYEEKMSKIRRKAQKFAQLIMSRYSNLGTKRLLEKARKLKQKYNFTDDEFHAFINLALGDKTISNTNLYNSPNTIIAQTLGYNPNANIGELVYRPQDASTIQEILSLHQEYLLLHQNVISQSLLYRDSAPEALTGKYDYTKFNAYTFIHPVIAALFLPRFKYLDEHMLIGSIANVIALRYNKTAIKTQPDWELFYDIISDPNEFSCSQSDNIFIDLLQRIKIQIELWKSVLALRIGRYYEKNELLLTLDNCKTGLFDSPEMTLIKDEGTILRKILATFSLRPTIVGILPLQMGLMMNYNLNTQSLTKIVSIPIVNFRLPLNLKNVYVKANLQEALEQPDMFIENKQLVFNMKTIIYSRDVIFFYVNRRYQNINFARFTTPCTFSVLPTTLSGFETLNETPIEFPTYLQIGDESFIPRSVVMIEKSGFNRDPNRDLAKEIIIGSSAGIIVPESISGGIYNKTCFIYDPQSAAIKLENDKGFFENRNPVTWVPFQGSLYGSDVESFEERASKRGTIFVYAKQEKSVWC